ncbi:MAG: hypothetical protein KGQ63_00105 [Betaproteobacteria bacterium]|nr:hypothetical protein [Betaproteobacteria bacterium]MDE1980900.1 hypothetical protein [Betaproteobacteria bacterium]
MFNSPLITVPSTIRAAPDSVRGFAYARYLVEHYNEPQSDGWKQIRLTLQLLEDRPLTASGRALSANNRDKAKKGRGKKEKIEIVAAVRKANPGETARGLWRHLKSYLTDQDMEPEETDDVIEYRTEDDVKQRITFKNFQKLLTEVKKKSS